MLSKEELRAILKESLDTIIQDVNRALNGENTEQLVDVLTRVGQGGKLPKWYEQLRTQHTLPNLDGKTIGSVIEMLLIAVLEKIIFQGLEIPPLRVNPARGVDFPDLDLGIKSPSENYCTSEPFFSAYERLLGSEYDVLVLLTDYQTAKKNPPLRLQIIKFKYLYKTQLADYRLCQIAKKHREWLVTENESWAKKVFRFLAYVNQSDWRAKQLLRLLDCLQDATSVHRYIQQADEDFQKINKKRIAKDAEPIPRSDIESLHKINSIQPFYLGVIDAADNWVIEMQKDLARFPNSNEWSRLLTSPLDGQIGMSPALQWRYNFSRVFGVNQS
ncbi:MAG: hypothetical protein RID53_00725 [Coleofasciculus sp. B1-GNL1-01]|uniref:hypothetical protein n=1 Tax=Coleofasciculus sp. B1-GNL1-01 TaxID=3068484 RepID=UPI0032F541DD